MIDKRRKEAKQSLLVQVRSKSSAEDLYNYCSKIVGKVAGMHYHKNPANDTFSVSNLTFTSLPPFEV